MVKNDPIQVGSGFVSPTLKAKLLEKYPMSQDEKECIRFVGSVDANLGERLVKLANEYFGIKE